MSSIPREHIDPDADKVVRRLKRHGFEAYLVGGCVRDLLLGRRPKDFDVATSATPPETKDLFRNCRIIGRRFRLAHIFFGQKIIETSTFRQNPREGVDIEEVEELLIRRDNVFGNAEEDARRRDFTINGLFYDVEAEQVIDYVGGRADLEARLVRTIGDPDIRFREDPVRILRAVKFAARLDFQIEPLTYAAILSHRGEIPKCAAPRVLEEVYRLLRGGAAKRSMELLLTTGVAATLAPELAWMFGGEAAAAAGLLPADLLPAWLAGDATLADEGRARAWRMLEILDGFVAAGSPEPVYHGQPTNALLVAMLVAPFLPELFAPAREKEERINDLSERIEGLIRPLSMRLRVSRRDAERARQVLLALRRLVPGRRRRARPMALVRRDYFPEALATYELLGQIAEGEERDELGRWKQMWRSAFRGGGGGAGERRDDRREHGRQGPDDARASRDRGDTSGRPAPAGESDAPRPIWDAEAELDELLSSAPPEGDGGEGAADDEDPDDLADETGGDAGGEAAAGGPAQPGDEAGRKRRRRRRGGRRRRRGGGEPAAAGSTGAAPLAADGQAVAAVAVARDDAGEP